MSPRGVETPDGPGGTHDHPRSMRSESSERRRTPREAGGFPARGALRPPQSSRLWRARTARTPTPSSGLLSPESGQPLSGLVLFWSLRNDFGGCVWDERRGTRGENVRVRGIGRQRGGASVHLLRDGWREPCAGGGLGRLSEQAQCRRTCASRARVEQRAARFEAAEFSARASCRCRAGRRGPRSRRAGRAASGRGRRRARTSTRGARGRPARRSGARGRGGA